MMTSQKGAIFVIIDIIVVLIACLLAILFLVKGYPNTLGNIIQAF